MTSVIGDFVERVDFKSYEDFFENFKLKYDDDFNFGFDVVDKYAEIDPDKIALIWTNDSEEKHTFTFKDMKKYSNRTANLFKSLGIIFAPSKEITQILNDDEYEKNKWDNRDASVSVKTIQSYEERHSLPVFTVQDSKINKPNKRVRL